MDVMRRRTSPWFHVKHHGFFSTQKRKRSPQTPAHAAPQTSASGKPNVITCADKLGMAPPTPPPLTCDRCCHRSSKARHLLREPHSIREFFDCVALRDNPAWPPPSPSAPLHAVHIAALVAPRLPSARPCLDCLTASPLACPALTWTPTCAASCLASLSVQPCVAPCSPAMKCAGLIRPMPFFGCLN